uniref:SCP domain-containing protein n=1 Tax=Globodera pallida TaxID=36090 RepID=A0A183BY91_GLOPA
MFAARQLLLLRSVVLLFALAVVLLLHSCLGVGEQCYYASRASREFPWPTGMRIEYLKLIELMHDWGTKDIQRRGLDAHTCNPPFQGCFTFVCKFRNIEDGQGDHLRVSGCTPDALDCNEQELMPICLGMLGKDSAQSACIKCNGTLCNEAQIDLGGPSTTTTTTTTTTTKASTTQRAGNESFNASVSTDQPLREDLNSTPTSKESSTGGAGAGGASPSVSPAILLEFGAPVVVLTNGAAEVASLSTPSAIAVLLLFGVVVIIHRCG